MTAQKCNLYLLTIFMFPVCVVMVHSYLGSMLLWPFLIHAAVFSSFVALSIAAKGLGNVTDHLALMAFKHQITLDPSVAVLSNWNDTVHFCQWRGIICSRRRHRWRVVALNLRGSGLDGSISPFIGNITFLQKIDLSDNNLVGEIPQQVGKLSRMRYLNLSRNSIGGLIPSNLSRCERLEIFISKRNRLTGRIPDDLAYLANLQQMGLGFNNLTGGIPPWIGNFSSLTYLSLLSNNLEGEIPGNLGRITGLSLLILSTNNLSGTIPPTIYNLSNLIALYMTENQLRGSLPSNLGHSLPNLVEFSVAVNSFTGHIPVSLANASRLRLLDFFQNRFSGLFPLNLGSLGFLRRLALGRNLLGGRKAEDKSFLISLNNCSLLEMLGLNENRLTGALDSMANLSVHLSALALGGNRLFGSIPMGIGNLFSLTELGIEENLLTGMIPMGIGNLNKLQLLSISGNMLSGPIPNSLGNFSQLFALDLSNNNLDGSIPPTLGSCQQLSQLFIHDNNLIGTIPKQVFNIPTLRHLDAGGNYLNGSLPTELGNLMNLGTLDVGMNNFSGEIPNTLDNCQSLEYIFIGGNFFQGIIPPLNSLKGIMELDFSNNKLSGKIPEFLGNFRYLQYLNLSFNDFEGEVPREGIFKNASAISIIGNKKLCGGAPELLLPECEKQATKKQRRHFSPEVMIPVVISSVLLLLLLSSSFALHYYRKTKSKKQPSMTVDPLEDQFLSVSYSDLYKATDGFSSANLIGIGSYGSVYKGSLHTNEVIVAVKVFNLLRRGALKSFKAECEILQNIRHRNLIKILSACSSIDFKGNDFKALVFEYLANGNLEQWLHRDTNEEHQSRILSFTQRLHIAIDVASALDYLHHCSQAPILHGDLKPSNVLIDDDMTARVGDFGLARFLIEPSEECSQSYSSSVNIKGTVGYVAPEYGMGGKPSKSGDIYSYGILILEMFTGKKPTDEMFKGDLSLHQFAKMVLPERVMEIIDPCLLSRGVDELQNHQHVKDRLEKCLVSMVKVGVTCSMASENDRMEIRDVMKEMHAIKNLFLAGGMYQEDRHNREIVLDEGPSFSLSN